ncbi:MAG: hypothetical protein SFV15_01815 [Polyangiaceae bacterium]|nr:hypothetical protein [Polyangiaceae bacterium]
MKAPASVGEEQVQIHGHDVARSADVFRSRPVLTALFFLGIGATLEFFGPTWAKLLASPNAAPDRVDQATPSPTQVLSGEAELREESKSAAALAQPEKVEAPTAPRGPLATEHQAEGGDDGLPDVGKPPRGVEHLESLHSFYEALARTERREPRAITRIAHFGDSVVASDFVSATLRRNFQKRFGDAGHGFSLIANAWPAYFHNDVTRFASEGWRVSRIVGPTVSDGWYGLGGVSFRAPPGVRARFGTATTGNFGRKVSRFDVAYVQEPFGGSFKVNLDGAPYGEIPTASPEKKTAHYEVRTTDGEHMLELVSSGPGSVRAFGVVMEREEPGVVWDALGILGARIRFLDKQDDAHYAESLRWRSPNLIVYQFGANESGDGWAYSMEDYHRTMKEVLLQGKAAVPTASCLIIGAMDRARVIENKTESMRIIPLIVEQQAKVAKEVGCAFFNTFLAMGGSGSMRTWVNRGWGAGDLTHPTSFGAQVLGDWIFAGMVDGYDKFHAAAAQPR